MLTLAQLQEEQKPWTEHNFPGKPSWHSPLGITEEVGELNHAYLKREQKIRGTTQEHEVDMFDAVGDILIYLSDFCTKESICLQTALEETWAKVKARDWQKDRDKGGE